MYATDYDRYEMCMRYARTMMMMAKIIKEKYGKEDDGFKSYVKQGMESCRMAQHYLKEWDQDATQILYLVA